MSLPFTATKVNRVILLTMLSKYNLDQLNFIPEGFNNNILWNIGHIVSIQQLLVYKLSSSRWRADNSVVKEFKNGTKPERTYTQEDVDILKDHILRTADQCETDYKEDYFGEYNEYTTITGFTLRNVEDAIAFNLYHEGLHLGYIMSLRKFINHLR